MPLGIAFKNHNCIVIASDQSPAATSSSGRMLTFINRTAIVICGNAAIIEPLIKVQVVPRILQESSTAEIARLIRSVLILTVVPNIGQLSGRTEIIVAGFDPIRHTSEPDVFYLDSAADYYGISSTSGHYHQRNCRSQRDHRANPGNVKTVEEMKSLKRTLRPPGCMARPPAHLRIATITADSLSQSYYR
jgi:hypothetical protein